MRIFVLTCLLIQGLAVPGFSEILQGRVLEDHSGTSVATASVKVKTSTGTTLRELETDGSGKFTVVDIPAGTYQVSISKSNYANVNATMAAQPDGAAVPVLRLVKLGVIYGHITSPRMGGSITAIEQVPQSHIPRTYSGMINASGDFRIFGIPPGRYVITAPITGNNNNPGNSRGFALYPSNSKPREFVISGGEQFEVLDFAVQAAGMSSISGTISSPAGPQTYTLTMVPSEYPSIRIMIALTAMDGSFRFDNIFPGPYELYASGPVTPPSYFAHTHLSLNSDNVQLNLQLKPGRSAQLELRAADSGVSACSAEGTVSLVSLGSWPLTRDQKMTASISPQAPAHFDNLGPGLFLVSAQSTKGNCPGVANRILDMSQDNATHIITGFRPTAMVHGNIAAMEVAVLRDMTPGRDAPTQVYFANTTSDFRFDGLAPGQYCVTRQSAADPVQRWLPESGCANLLIELLPGDSKELK